MGNKYIIARNHPQFGMQFINFQWGTHNANSWWFDNTAMLMDAEQKNFFMYHENLPREGYTIIEII